MDEEKKPRMAGDKLAAKRKEYRESLQNDDEKRAARIERIKFGDGLESLPDDYDDKLVAQALRGSWGDEDLARYNDLLNGGENDGGDNSGGDEEDTTTPPEDTTDPITPPTEIPGDKPFSPIIPGPGSPGGQTNYQDNDNQVVQGDNSTNNQVIDNSISQGFGGYSQANKFKNRFMKEYDFFK